MHATSTSANQNSWNGRYRLALLILLVSIVAVGMIVSLAPPVPQGTPATPFSFPFGQTIELQVGDAEMQGLQARRDAALRQGIHIDDDDSWAKAKLVEGAQAWPVRIRLKGDWTDHLEGEKWSFRVELRDSMVWHRLSVFSLQSPERRGFLNEWLFHQVLAREGLLTPRYDFIYLKINGKLLGTYALEEHFAKELMESQGRREGVLLKIDESGMWDARVASLQNPTFPYLQRPFFEAAPLLPFQKKHVRTDSLLSAQFAQAQRLMLQYRAGVSKPSFPDSLVFVTNGTPVYKLDQVFDVALIAKQYALTDLFAAYHSLIWHNRRFYYNPVTQKLEPVVFDGFSGPTNDTYIPYPFWGYKLYGKSRDDAAYRDATSVNVFQDPDFVREYFRQLERYCQPAFLAKVLADLRPAMDARAHMLRSEYWSYTPDRATVVANAAKISGILQSDLNPDYFFVRQYAEGEGAAIYIRNHNPLPVEFWADGQSVNEAQLLDANCSQKDQKEAFFKLDKGQKIYFRVPGTAQRRVLDLR